MFEHFEEAQEGVYDLVLQELCAGTKRTHWMWFIFPQLERLGKSALSRRYAIRDLDQAVAYADHPKLGMRLRECVGVVNTIEGRTARQVFGRPDDLKFRSCLTLFLIATNEDVFRRGLDIFYEGKLDSLTVRLINEL